MNLLTLDKLNPNQRKVAKSTEEFVLVDSPAASGKTATLTTRIKYLMEEYPFDKIVALTFTNNAAEEMKGRLGEINDNVIVSTLHSYCLSLLSMKGIETAALVQAIHQEKFDKILDVMLAHPEAAEHIDWLLIDECQDCCKTDFEIIETCLKPVHCMMFGDARQSIYGFRGASPQDFENYRYDPKTTVYCLNENYRNSPEIFDFSKQFLDDYFDNTIASMILHKREGGFVDSVGSTEWQLPSKLKVWAWEEDWKNWAILTRTNRDLDNIRQALMENNIPSITFKQGDLSNEEIKEAMESNRVKVLTVHSAKGLEFPKVIVFGLATSPSKKDEERRLQYVAATRAKDELYWCRKLKAQKRTGYRKPKFHSGATFGEVF